MEFIIATKNEDKLREIKNLFEGSEHILHSLREFPGAPDVEESGRTYAENALIKGRAASEFTGLPAIADDSGLEVDALNGQPGIRSARFAGENATYEDNNRLLLSKLVSVPAEKRGAQFVCAAAIVAGGNEITVKGEVKGSIANTPRGGNGFGYDPIFIPEGLDETFGEMTPEAKDLMSHRARAFKHVLEILRTL